MKVEIVYKASYRPNHGTKIIINDVYSIEKYTFEVILRQLKSSFEYRTLRFNLDEIREINIIKL